MRATTVIALRGLGHEGLGEDVTYATEDHDALNAAGPTLPLAGSWTLERFSAQLAALDLFPAPLAEESGDEIFLDIRRRGNDGGKCDRGIGADGDGNFHFAAGPIAVGEYRKRGRIEAPPPSC